MLTGTTMPQAHQRDRVRRRLLRLPRIGHRLHHVVHQGAVDRGRHPQLPVPRPPGRDVRRTRRRAAPAPAGLSHRHQHSAVHRDHHLRARCLLAAAQGVKNYGLEMGETLHLVQDAAAVAACGELCQEYLVRKGLSRRVHAGDLAALDERVAAGRSAGGGAGLLRRHARGDRAAPSASRPRRPTRRSAFRRRRPTPKACG